MGAGCPKRLWRVHAVKIQEPSAHSPGQLTLHDSTPEVWTG